MMVHFWDSVPVHSSTFILECFLAVGSDLPFHVQHCLCEVKLRLSTADGTGGKDRESLMLKEPVLPSYSFSL